MYLVDQQFTTALKNNARYIKCYFKYGNTQYSPITVSIEDNIYKTSSDGDVFIGTFIGKSGTIKLRVNDNLDIENKDIEMFFGIVVSDQSIKYVPMGTYRVYEKTGNYEYKICDHKLLFNEKINTTEITYPTTPSKLATWVGGKIGMEVIIPTDLPNKDLAIPNEVFFGYDATYANVVEVIAQATCTFAHISRENKLEFRWFKNVDFTINVQNMPKGYPTFSDSIDPINTVVLAREPQNDNVYWPETVEGERSEFKISNNPILDIDRYTSRKDIFDRINGFSYTPVTIETQGFFHLDTGDIVKLEKSEGVFINMLIMNHSLSFSGGISSKFETPALSKTMINYAASSSVESKIYNTQLQVDKIENTIIAEISEINTKIENISIPYVNVAAPDSPVINQHWVNIAESPPREYVWNGSSWEDIGEYTGDLEGLLGQIKDLNTSLTMQQGKVDVLIENNTTEIDGNEVTVKSVAEQLLLTVDGLSNRVTTTGGNNLVKDSMGVFGDGFSGNYYIDKSLDIQKRNLYGFAIRLANDSLYQSISVPNGSYTLSFSYCKWVALAAVSVVINGKELPLSNTAYTQFKHTFSVDSGTIDITFRSDTDMSCTIVNLMLNQGSEAMIWSLNANETWTESVKMSSSGITIESSGADVLFSAKADIIGFKNKNTSEYVAVFTDVGATMKELTVKNKAKIVGLLFQEINGQTVINKLGGSS